MQINWNGSERTDPSDYFATIGEIDRLKTRPFTIIMPQARKLIQIQLYARYYVTPARLHAAWHKPNLRVSQLTPIHPGWQWHV